MNDDLRAMKDSEGACQRAFDAVMAERAQRRRIEFLSFLAGAFIIILLLIAKG